MSQEKVDRYKKEKANRKKNLKKEKFQNILRKCVVGVVTCIDRVDRVFRLWNV